jgi:hypothetical protein
MAQIKRIFNKEELIGKFRVLFHPMLQEAITRKDEEPTKYGDTLSLIDWMTLKTIPKWFQQDDRNQTLFTPVKLDSPKMSLIKDDSVLAKRIFYEDKVVGDILIFHETEFDFKDAANNSLVFFLPENWSSLNTQVKRELICASDYVFNLWLTTPDFDLRKITPQQAYQKHLADKEAELKRIAKEAAEAAERRRVAELEAFEARKNMTRVEKETGLIPGVDYYQVDQEGDFVFLILNTQAALDYESNVLSHCVYSYLNRITKGYSTVLSLRNKVDLLVPIGTIELVLRGDSGYEPVQISGFDNGDLPENLQKMIETRAKAWTPKTFAPLIEEGQEVPQELLFRVKLGKDRGTDAAI